MAKNRNGSIYDRGNKLVNEVVTVQRARCAHRGCRQRIHKGDNAITIKEKNGNVRIRWCSFDCWNLSEAEVMGWVRDKVLDRLVEEDERAREKRRALENEG